MYLSVSLSMCNVHRSDNRANYRQSPERIRFTREKEREHRIAGRNTGEAKISTDIRAIEQPFDAVTGLEVSSFSPRRASDV